MGIDYSVILSVGKEFEDDDEVLEFIQENSTQELSEDDLEDIDANGFSEFLYDKEYFSGIECETINCYSGYGRVLGYSLSIRPPERFAENVKEAQAKFKEHFGIEGDIICTVSVH